MSRIVQAIDNCLLFFIILCLTSAAGYSQSTPPNSQPLLRQVADSNVSHVTSASSATSRVTNIRNNPASVRPVQVTRPISSAPGRAGSRTVMLSSILLLIGFSFLYRRFILNKKSAVHATVQQKILADKNQVINRLLASDRNLVHEKDHLLEQQEWVSNEIQHRVKNNVQNLLGMLNAPSGIMQDPEALEVVESNSRKLYAIALMHHKKNQLQHAGALDINELIPDLIESLALTHEAHSGARIVFSSPSRCIDLETSQALALAMIINDILSWFITIAETNYFLYSIGLYLQETKGLIKLTVKAEGIYRSKDLEQLKKGLRQTLVSHFPEEYNTRFSIDNNLGIQMNVQFEKQTARKAALA